MKYIILSLTLLGFFLIAMQPVLAGKIILPGAAMPEQVSKALSASPPPKLPPPQPVIECKPPFVSSVCKPQKIKKTFNQHE